MVQVNRNLSVIDERDPSNALIAVRLILEELLSELVKLQVSVADLATRVTALEP